MRNFIWFILTIVSIAITAKYSIGDEAWPGGTITLDTSPDSADVYINGTKVGYTPMTEAPIDSGFTTISIIKKNYYKYTRRIYTKAYKYEQHAGFVKLNMVLKYPKNAKSVMGVKFGYLDSIPLLKTIPNISELPKVNNGKDKVIFNVLVDINGKVCKTSPFMSSGNHRADSIALSVIKGSQFTPAMTSYHEPIRYWTKVPFKLKNK